jgi:MipA family protein
MLSIKNIKYMGIKALSNCSLLKALLALTFSLGLQNTSVSAKESCESPQKENCVEQDTFHLGLSIGLGLVSNPLNQSDNIPLVLLPSVSYYSGNFFLENLDFGYTLYDTEQSSLSILASPSYDSVFFNRWDPGNIFVELGASAVDGSGNPSIAPSTPDRETQINPDELSTRKFSYLGGLEYSFEWPNQLIQVTALRDVSGVHSGSEVRFAYQYQATENIRTTAGFTWKDKNLTDYYYGIDEEEIIDNRASYQAQSSLSPFFRATYRTSLGDGDSLRVSFQYQKLASQISDSPVVADDYVLTFFAGRTFSF